MSAKLVRDDQRVLPAFTEPLAAGVVGFLGGPPGRHALIGRQRLSPQVILTVTAMVFLALGYLFRVPCITGTLVDSQWSLNWSGNRQYVAACYSDIIPLYNVEGLQQGHLPYAYSWQEGDQTRYMEYPVASGFFMYLMASLTRALAPLMPWLPAPEVTLYFTLTAFVLGFFWLLTIRALTRLAGNRVWDIVLVAASPLVIVHAFTNYDILPIFCAVLAIEQLGKHRFVPAGLLIGLGTALKLWPLFLLGAVLTLAVRRRAYRGFLLTLFTTVLTWLALNLPVALTFPAGWREFFRLNSERGAEWTTIYELAARMFGLHLAPETINKLSFFLFAAACAAIFVFGIRCPKEPRLVQLALLIVAAFLLFNKVWSPQYSLWLLPLIVLALPHWRLVATWAAAEALVWPILMWHLLGVENKGLGPELLNVIILVRDGLLIAVVVSVIRVLADRRADKVRNSHGGFDPATIRPRRPEGI
ncbi:glycosyltransferase 87 family protein [uncultured Corynebacterium sp.]|uniref:glycosyltransferase family 87 protein n=1 Tax=uncultured Corynebacterium sp. TaxID=159447 RepID=UPI002622AF5D|nr:glycosyltransferase 87 family protein [uncultured Corynebacterium sp.]